MIIATEKLLRTFALVQQYYKVAAIDKANEIDPPFATDIEHQHTRHQDYEHSQMQNNSLFHNRTYLIGL